MLRKFQNEDLMLRVHCQGIRINLFLCMPGKDMEEAENGLVYTLVLNLGII